MVIKTRPVLRQKFANEDTSFNVTLAVAGTAEDLVTVPSGKKGRIVSIVNEGPGAIAVAFDVTATTSDLLLEEGDAYADQGLEISTNVSFINVTVSETPRVRGVLWSGLP
ncbi:hypothetical protein LCGC14_0310630 [marine sediment metagenome]|uniref:Uncharacterized protein n=1 Tax=marine sediment metagenome TaxID=412755 RepID=A0A0F9TM61_9ZZZZ